MNLRLVSKVVSSFIFEFAEYTDVDPSLWAEAETLILSQLSDSESADTAIEFCDVALRRPGTTEEVVSLSRFVRRFPGIIDQVTANVSKLKQKKRELTDASKAGGREAAGQTQKQE